LYLATPYSDGDRPRCAAEAKQRNIPRKICFHQRQNKAGSLQLERAYNKLLCYKA
jgi:hypothetical protein